MRENITHITIYKSYVEIYENKSKTVAVDFSDNIEQY